MLDNPFESGNLWHQEKLHRHRRERRDRRRCDQP